MEGCWKRGGIKERRDSGLEGYTKAGKEGSGHKVCGTGEKLDRRNTGKVECRTGGIQYCRDAGKERCKKGGMQESRGAGTKG